MTKKAQKKNNLVERYQAAYDILLKVANVRGNSYRESFANKYGFRKENNTSGYIEVYSREFDMLEINRDVICTTVFKDRLYITEFHIDNFDRDKESVEYILKKLEALTEMKESKINKKIQERIRKIFNSKVFEEDTIEDDNILVYNQDDLFKLIYDTRTEKVRLFKRNGINKETVGKLIKEKLKNRKKKGGK